MRTAVVESPENEQGLAWSFLDTFVVEHRCAPEMDTVVRDMASAVISAPRFPEDVGPKQLPGRLVARWVQDPLGQQNLICIWVPRTEGESSPRTSILIPGQLSN